MADPKSLAAMPPMMYGTAWKKERTADLVYEAIKAGFRGIDTAAMKKHYDEALAAEGIRRAIREGIVSRKDLFVRPSRTHPLTHHHPLTPNKIQTKFSPLDTTSPHDPSTPIPTQITTSVLSSLSHFTFQDQNEQEQEPYIDALLLHSPFPHPQQTLLAWSTLQSYLPSSSNPSRAGKIRSLGISNVFSLELLDALYSSYSASVTSLSPSPSMVIQNRFCASEKAWDRRVRGWCAAKEKEGEGVGVVYQGFWTLTGNRAVCKLYPTRLPCVLVMPRM